MVHVVFLPIEYKDDKCLPSYDFFAEDTDDISYENLWVMLNNHTLYRSWIRKEPPIQYRILSVRHESTANTKLFVYLALW